MDLEKRIPRSLLLGLLATPFLLAPLPEGRASQDRAAPSNLRNAVRLAKEIDSALKFRKGVEPAPAGDDGEFMRRVMLDLVGRIPTGDEARAFLEDRSETKRRDLIEKLLASPAFADQWSRIWCEILLGNYRDLEANIQGKRLGRGKMQERFGRFRHWLRDQIAGDVPWPKIVMELIQAQGKLSENPAVLYKAAFFRDGPATLNIADAMSRSLLGMRISCARCHDHPFDRWSREDYYGLAAFLARMKARPIGGAKEDECDDADFYEESKGEMNLPASGKVIRAKFLFGGVAGTKDPRLNLLARFMTTPRNTQLSRNVVNRIWAWLMGRGFVEPVDDFNQQNRPVHSRVMELIRRDFARNRYSLQFLFRAVCNSASYQRACGGTSEPFAAAAVRTMTAEQLFRTLWTACTGSVDFGTKPARDAWRDFRNQLPDVFGAGKAWTEVTLTPGNTRQILLLRNSKIVEALVRRGGGLLSLLRDGRGSVEDKIDRVFVSVLTRHPTSEERSRYGEYLAGGGSRWEDVIWALLNCAEFSLRH